MFVAIIIRLRHEGYILTFKHGLYAHAAICQAISHINPYLGRQLHDAGRSKRMTIALVKREPGYTVLRITFMTPAGLEYAHQIVDALARQPMLRLEYVDCQVDSIDMNSQPWTGVATWEDLVGGTLGRTFQFRLVTPMAITKHDELGKRFMMLFPQPLEIYQGLARQWTALGGPAFSDNLQQFLHAGGCVVARFDISSEVFQTSERTQIGCLGAVTFRYRGQESQNLATLNSLTRLAFYTGVGYQCTRGMGATITTIA